MFGFGGEWCGVDGVDGVFFFFGGGVFFSSFFEGLMG